MIVFVDEIDHKLLEVDRVSGEEHQYAPDPLLVEQLILGVGALDERAIVEAFARAWILDPQHGDLCEIEGIQASGWQPAEYDGESCVKNELYALTNQ